MQTLIMMMVMKEMQGQGYFVNERYTKRVHVPFLSQEWYICSGSIFSFYCPLFWGMVMYDNEF